jgi:hypothetical protein
MFAIEKGQRHTLKLGANKITTSAGLLYNLFDFKFNLNKTDHSLATLFNREMKN